MPVIFDPLSCSLKWVPPGFSGAYSDLTGIPSSFPPSAHTHPQSDVVGLGAALGAKEPSIAAGTASQYWRGDKTWQTLNGSAVGLGNVNNTSDASKPISTLTQAALDTKEPTIAAGTTSQYWRGDKTWQTLNAATVGLGNVNNTSDVNKPISTATQSALNAKADLVGGVVPTSQIPSVAISEFLGTVASQAAMLALVGEKGDWTIRSDTGATWIITGTNPALLAHWTAISYPTSPVTSVNTQTGNVVLGYADVGAEPTIAAGTTAQYWRGDKSWQTLNKAAVGLANVANVDTTNAANISSGTLLAARMPALTGDVTTSAGAVATTIANGAVTLAKMADMATGSLIYRKTAGSGPPEINTLATLKTDLLLTGTNSGDQTITLTSDVTGSGSGSFAATIAANAVGLTKLADIATASFLGRNTAGTGDPEVLSATTAKAILAIAQADVAGLRTADSPTFAGLTVTGQLKLNRPGQNALAYLNNAGSQRFAILRSYASSDTDDIHFYDVVNDVSRIMIGATGGINIGLRVDPGAGNLAINHGAATTPATRTTYGMQLSVPIGTNAFEGLYLGIGADSVYSYIQSWGARPLRLNSQGNSTLFGGGVNIGGTTDPGAGNLACNNLPVLRVLATVTGIDAKTAADSTLYTVPAGKSLVITSVVVRCTAAVSISAPAAASIITGALFQVWPNRSLTGLTVATAMNSFVPDNTWNIVLAAATSILFRINTAATGTSQTLAVDVIGYLL